MIKKEKLGIHKQYLIISAPCEFELISNFGTDKVSRPSGIWQLDCYKLLPEKFQKNYPVFNLELQYDEDKVPSGFTFEYYFSDLNLGDSLKGVSGDLVELSNVQFESIQNDLGILKANTENQIENLTSIDTNINTINSNLLLVKEDINNNNIELKEFITDDLIDYIKSFKDVRTEEVTTSEIFNRPYFIFAPYKYFTISISSPGNIPSEFVFLKDVFIRNISFSSSGFIIYYKEVNNQNDLNYTVNFNFPYVLSIKGEKI